MIREVTVCGNRGDKVSAQVSVRSRNPIVTAIIKAGYQLDAECFPLLEQLCEQGSVEECVKKLITNVELHPPLNSIISAAFLQSALQSKPTEEPSQSEAQLDVTTGGGKTTFAPLVRDLPALVEKIKDPADFCPRGSTIQSYLSYFKDRFQKLHRILKQRLDTRDAVTVQYCLRAPPHSKIKVIGMVSRLVRHKERVVLTLEDLEDAITVLVQPAQRVAWSKAAEILPDEVICVVGGRGSGDVVYAEDFLWPDIPSRTLQPAPDPVCAVLTSDLHIGSRFCELKLLERFVAWLKGDYGNHQLRNLAGRVKYVVVAGDLVDGVGIYPNQVAELDITNIFRQYERVTQLLSEIPAYIQLIVTPGNHDAVGQTLPQSAIPFDYLGSLYQLGNVMGLGNPAQVKLHNVNILIHHGRSLEDPLAMLPNTTHLNPTAAMTHLLKARHTAPVYGQRTPLAPEEQDRLIIDSPPDIYHAGHVHVLDHQNYRGTLLLNSGSWQSQTPYQRKMRIMPTWGVAPVVDLQTFKIHAIDFAHI